MGVEKHGGQTELLGSGQTRHTIQHAVRVCSKSAAIPPKHDWLLFETRRETRERMPKPRRHVCMAKKHHKDELYRVTVTGQETRTRGKLCRQGTTDLGTISCEVGAKTKAPLR